MSELDKALARIAELEAEVRELRLRLDGPEKCPKCAGYGAVEVFSSDSRTCPVCHGNGVKQGGKA